MLLPGRRPPFDARISAPRVPAPLSVSHLEPGGIVLSEGLARQTIPFDDHGPRCDNPALFDALRKLNADGIPFQYQPQVVDAPARLMAWWQETGRLADTFSEIAWLSPEQWRITSIPVPVQGVMGWDGRAGPFAG
ncbi:MULTISPECIES: hypothetical protein [Stenotrophomonas]|uniref:Uncharacterized protein n=1 Tax=Stenotrophomonas maltophilia TaxID=40324 RepID=A0A4S2CWY5_STEMA|nr:MULTISPECIES: hypothetical protein [Stenotrophomonas]MBD3825577.1 hypothetical protein [Stenotrophomonas sp.]TGY33042.1 hypothetical protein E5352_14010 [Stenotrophomonas maltophilia]